MKEQNRLNDFFAAPAFLKASVLLFVFVTLSFTAGCSSSSPNPANEDGGSQQNDSLTTPQDGTTSADAGADTNVSVCQGVVCDDQNPCTTDSCDDEGACVHEPVMNGTACDDGDLCTIEDVCSLGSCQGAPKECPQAQAACTALQACDGNTGECVEQPAVDGSPCDDADPCTTQDSCQSGACQGTPLIECFYLVAPNIAACQEGVLAQERKQDALDALNEVRTLHGLLEVPYDPSADVATQKSALMMVANSDIEHEPPTNWYCWSQEGFDAANSSNLSILWRTSKDTQVSPHEEIIGWLIDDNVPSLGHRRWLLDPFLRAISFGSVDGTTQIPTDFPWSHSSVLKVIWDDEANISGMTVPKVVAYPDGDYPSAYVKKDWFFSASILVNAQSYWANEDVSFENTQITVTGPQGALSVYDVYYDNDWFGLPNNIQWKVQGLQDNVEYTVVLQPVIVQGASQSFSYNFRLK